jgi:hypothetical protein
MQLKQQALHNDHQQTILRLTALWALSESGLGGMMHALKIPFTGFFLGGFAIVMITLIAFVSDKPFKTILQATLLVVLVKAAASPHSPPMAYIAVGFQGLIGALVFSLIPLYKLAATLFGGLALLESAVQKWLVATLIFGKNIWEALDGFVNSVLNDLSLFHSFSFSFWLIAIYTTIYVLWGCVLGWWASRLFEQLKERSGELLLQFDLLQKVSPIETIPQKQHRFKKLKKGVGLLLVLAFIVVVFWIQGSEHKALMAIGRTLAALLLLFYVLNPCIQWLMHYWLSKKKSSTELNKLLATLPELRMYIAPAMLLARQENKGLRVYKAFVENLIVLVLYK